MANHKSAIKRHRQSIKRRDRNRSARSKVRTAVKDAANSDKDIKKLALVAESMLASAAKKGLIHPKTARRKISRLAKRAAKAK